MRAGALRHRVDIESVTLTKDTLGGSSESWSKDYKNVRAAIEPISASDYLSSQQQNAEITTKIRIRYLSGITTKHRVVFGSRTFEIMAPPINQGERNRELVLMCREVV